MGNTLGRKKTTKVMKVTGETMKLKIPVTAGEVTKDYPSHVLLESEAVKHFGIRAKPLESQQELKPKRLYFLVEMPKFPAQMPRRVRSEIKMSAKDRLESLMLARRSVSDLSIMKPASIGVAEEGSSSSSGAGKVQVKMRVPKAEVDRLVKESGDENEAVKKIVDLCMANPGGGSTSMHRRTQWKGCRERETNVRFDSNNYYIEI
ncbi:uncharacterized protein At1g66480-like [Malania oleifera]|uniref:uncharacterized protein At1g66480-like n=1 Tax=Malania oleifera TaxID=397392 RepID=UPI0025ADA31F|nr:uncharacterized protein At1g66480-like [Malania oleifera]